MLIDIIECKQSLILALSPPEFYLMVFFMGFFLPGLCCLMTEMMASRKDRRAGEVRKRPDSEDFLISGERTTGDPAKVKALNRHFQY